MKAKYKVALGGLGLLLTGCPAFADCSGLPNFTSLKTAVAKAVDDNNGGLAFNMWATLVSNDGTVCAVAFAGGAFTDQWLGSRVISAQKANTANAFNLGSPIGFCCVASFVSPPPLTRSEHSSPP